MTETLVKKEQNKKILKKEPTEITIDQQQIDATYY